MSDEVFRQTRQRVTAADLNDDMLDSNPLEGVRHVQEAVAKESGREMPKSLEDLPFKMAGNVPPELKQMLQQKANPQQMNVSEEDYETFEAPVDRPKMPVKKSVEPKIRVQGSDALETLLKQLSSQYQTWEKFEFPSKGKFYSNIPPVIHVRAMTGGEEQILATPRFVKQGTAIDMIFKKCIKENIDTEELLSSDRTHLLIFLRGISYTPEYDVEIKCPGCQMKFAHLIDLNDLEVENCPDDFGPDSLHGVLPVSGFTYSYRLAVGQDEREVSNYRDKRIRQYGDTGEDDTLLYRTALLLEDIQGVTAKKELSLLLKKLPIQDVAHLRNEINTPPFGVDTELPILCPSCTEEFKIDLPLETSFFFPRKKIKETQV